MEKKVFMVKRVSGSSIEVLVTVIYEQHSRSIGMPEKPK
jgi:hypothetical protein